MRKVRTVTFKLTRGEKWWTVTSSRAGLVTQGRTVPSALRNAADAFRLAEVAGKKMKRNRNRPMTADGVVIRKGMYVWQIATDDNGRKWRVQPSVKVTKTSYAMGGSWTCARLPMSGMSLWTMMFGDNRAFSTFPAAMYEAARRNDYMARLRELPQPRRGKGRAKHA